MFDVPVTSKPLTLAVAEQLANKQIAFDVTTRQRRWFALFLPRIDGHGNMSDPAVEAKFEVKQASKEVKESENVAEKYSAMTVSKNSEMNAGDLSPVFSAVPTHKPVKKVRPQQVSAMGQPWRTINTLTLV